MRDRAHRKSRRDLPPDCTAGSQTAPFDSFIKIKVDVNSAAPPNDTYFSFHYFWTNENNFAVAVSAKTSLIFNGYCTVDSDSFLFFADLVVLLLGASHTIWRWSGWGNDPVIGTSLNETKIFEPYDHLLVDFWFDPSGYGAWLSCAGSA
jgi:hypothetical protein